MTMACPRCGGFYSDDIVKSFQYSAGRTMALVCRSEVVDHLKEIGLTSTDIENIVGSLLSIRFGRNTELEKISEDATISDIHIMSIARICYEANRAYCLTIGDHSIKPWDLCESWQIESAMAGVNFIIENPDASPSQSHESWLRHKADEGWKYGPVKDPVKKEHPCFVPYSELPRNQKMKDHIFTAIVKAYIEGLH